MDEDPAMCGTRRAGDPVEERAPALLCVDDEPEVLEVLKEYFTLQGFDVFTARSGIEALFRTLRWSPRAIILDLFIPDLSGIEALARIRQLAPETAIVLISGVPNVLEMVDEAGLSVAGAFTKPLDLSQISEALARAGVVPLKALAAAASRGSAPNARPPAPRRAPGPSDNPRLVEALWGRGFEPLRWVTGTGRRGAGGEAPQG